MKSSGLIELVEARRSISFHIHGARNQLNWPLPMPQFPIEFSIVLGKKPTRESEKNQWLERTCGVAMFPVPFEGIFYVFLECFFPFCRPKAERLAGQPLIAKGLELQCGISRDYSMRFDGRDENKLWCHFDSLSLFFHFIVKQSEFSSMGPRLGCLLAVLLSNHKPSARAGAVTRA